MKFNKTGGVKFRAHYLLENNSWDGSKTGKFTIRPVYYNDGEQAYVFPWGEPSLQEVWITIRRYDSDSLKDSIFYELIIEDVKSLESAKNAVAIYTAIGNRQKKLQERFGSNFGYSFREWFVIACEGLNIKEVEILSTYGDWITETPSTAAERIDYTLRHAFDQTTGERI